MTKQTKRVRARLLLHCAPLRSRATGTFIESLSKLYIYTLYSCYGSSYQTSACVRGLLGRDRTMNDDHDEPHSNMRSQQPRKRSGPKRPRDDDDDDDATPAAPILEESAARPPNRRRRRRSRFERRRAREEQPPRSAPRDGAAAARARKPLAGRGRRRAAGALRTSRRRCRRRWRRGCGAARPGPSTWWSLSRPGGRGPRQDARDHAKIRRVFKLFGKHDRRSRRHRDAEPGRGRGATARKSTGWHGTSPSP